MTILAPDRRGQIRNAMLQLVDSSGKGRAHNDWYADYHDNAYSKFLDIAQRYLAKPGRTVPEGDALYVFGNDRICAPCREMKPYFEELAHKKGVPLVDIVMEPKDTAGFAEFKGMAMPFYAYSRNGQVIGAGDPNVWDEGLSPKAAQSFLDNPRFPMSPDEYEKAWDGE